MKVLLFAALLLLVSGCAAVGQLHESLHLLVGTQEEVQRKAVVDHTHHSSDVVHIK